VGHRRCRAGTEEGIEDEIAGIGGDVDNAMDKPLREADFFPLNC
jgi:hypothetical protein